MKMHKSFLQLQLAAAALAMDSGQPRRSQARHRCTACGCEIPPGKAGRKCKDCREGRSVSTSSRSHQTRLEFFDGPCVIRDDIKFATASQLIKTGATTNVTEST